ncbi:MAG: hypothetical protein QM669_08325 [Siphonobacter sp.]
MKILNFQLSESIIESNQAVLSDTIRSAVYEEDKSFFDLLNYNDDATFLEPSAFCHFLFDSKEKISLQQSLIGYGNEASRCITFKAVSDQFGKINLPNKGYLSVNANSERYINIDTIHSEFCPNEFIPDTQIRLCTHLTDLLDKAEGLVFHQSPETTSKSNKMTLLIATNFLRSYLPDFWKLLKYVTKEIVMFSSSNYNSFAGIMHHGTAYFNTEGKLQTLSFLLMILLISVVI